MTTIPLRQAEFLSYLQGFGLVGEWVCPLTKHMAEDLDIARAQVCQTAAILAKKGFIAMRYNPDLRGKEYRVLIRLERPDVEIIDHGTRSDISREKMRQKALVREERRRAMRPKIRWAGYDRRELTRW